jgi:hypothetical protein
MSALAAPREAANPHPVEPIEGVFGQFPNIDPGALLACPDVHDIQ